VAGGIAAAVTGPTGWERGSWVAAFLVLVTGVGQIGLGAGQALIAALPIAPRRLVVQAGALDLGSALVILGTLLMTPAAVTLGGLVLAVGLVAFATVARQDSAQHRWVDRTYTTLLTVLIVSTPVGLALAWARA